MQTGSDLVHDIRECQLPTGQAALWWLGQHGFVVKLGQTVLVIDAYLSPAERRQVEPLLAPDELGFCTIMLGTHDHSDHIDRPSWAMIADLWPELQFAVPAPVRESVCEDLEIARERVLGLRAGKTIEHGAIRITPVPAAHEFLDCAADTGDFLYLGLMLEGHGCTVYHAGDTCLYEGIHDQLRPFEPDVMLLPINGRDAERLKRGCIGNMTYQEAADLAGAIAPVLTIPAHFEMFAGNTADPAAFTAYVGVKYPHLDALIPVHGERIEVVARTAGG